MNKKNNTKVNQRKTFLRVIESSVGCEMFKHMYASVNGGPEQDILKDGELSCAFYVSSVLVMFDLISEVHTTVGSTVKELRDAGHDELSDLESAEPGAVIVWEGIEYSDGVHKHIGFYTGNDQAISNSWTEGVPKSHHVTFGKDDDNESGRAIQAVFSLNI